MAARARGLRRVDAALRREVVGRVPRARARATCSTGGIGIGAYGILSSSVHRLPDRQPDGAGELQLRLLEIVLGRDHPLALRLQLHLRAQHVDAGDDAGGLEILRLLVERLRGVVLRARHLDAAAVATASR